MLHLHPTVQTSIGLRLPSSWFSAFSGRISIKIFCFFSGDPLEMRPDQADEPRPMVALADHVEATQRLLDLLPACANSGAQNEFVSLCQSFLDSQSLEYIPEDLFAQLGATLAQETPAQHPAAAKAWESYKKNKILKRNFQRRLKKDLGMNLLPGDRDSRLNEIPAFEVERLAQPYPPPNYWIYKTRTIGEQWEQHIKHEKQPDDRLTRKPMHQLDMNMFQHIVKADSDAIFIDKHTKQIVALVMRNFVNRQDILDWASEVIEEAVGMKKSARLEDAGSIVLEGYTAGARSQPMFGWARNLKRKMADKDARSQRYRSSSLFALLWNMIRTRLPEEILADFDKYLHDNSLLRMDGGSKGKSEIRFTVGAGEWELDFFDLELAPPSGAIGKNYARRVHSEKSPIRYAISWNCVRALPTEYGGNFNYSAYGIHVEGSSDMLYLHEPEEFHGTDLPWRGTDENGEEFWTNGISFIFEPKTSQYFHCS
jgi:hypothetical protein